MRIMSAPVLFVLAAMLAPARAQDPAPLQRFESRNRTYAIDLPAGWRQMTPKEGRELRAQTPADMHETQPQVYYGIGDVDRWLRDGFDGLHLWVVEQGSEWVTEDIDLSARLREQWLEYGSKLGLEYVIDRVERTEIGRDRHPAIVCERRLLGGPRPLRGLDVYVGTGGQQITFAFRCHAEEYERHLPLFQRMLATAVFARRARGSASLGDSLWPAVLTGALVSGVLLVLYKMQKRRQLAG